MHISRSFNSGVLLEVEERGKVAEEARAIFLKLCPGNIKDP